MINVSFKGKDPKIPRNRNYLKICRKDFKNFKKRDYEILISHLSRLETDYEMRGLNPETVKKQKEKLEQIKKLIDKGNEQVAFHNFLRSFPSCLPYRGFEPRY